MSEEPAQLNNPAPPHRAAPACHYVHFAGGVVKVPMQSEKSFLDGKLASGQADGPESRRIES